jgi:predicted permease
MPWSLFIPIVLLAALAIGVEIAFAMRDHPTIRSVGPIAIFGVVVFPVAIVVHNALSAFTGGEEGVSFILALVVAPAAITLGTIGVAVRLRDAHATPLFIGFAAAGAGMGLFAAYLVFALGASVVTGMPAGEPGAEVALLAAAGLTIVCGAAYAAFVLVREGVPPPRLG